MRKTKIVCTLGPASSDYETLKAMVEAGMDIVRLNFSHVQAKAIICFTEHGFTARILSKYRQPIPVIAVTPTEAVQRRLLLYWGVRSLQLQEVYNTDAMIILAERAAVEHGFVARGDIVVMIAGLPLPITGVTNLIKAHRIGEQVAV